MLRGLVVTHGELGRVLVTTAEGIVGPAEDLEVLSNQGHSRESLAAAVEERIRAWGGVEGILLTDVPGGSCTQAVLSRLPQHPNLRVVSGANLSMIVDFLAHRDRFGAQEMAERLIARGRAAVRSFPAPEPGAGRTPS